MPSSAPHQDEVQLNVHHLQMRATQPGLAAPSAPHQGEVQWDRQLRPRRVVHRGDLALHSDKDRIMVIDSGCDQSIINSSSFLVKSYTGLYFNVGNAVNTNSSCNKLELVNDAYTVVKLPQGLNYLIRLNQVLLDPDSRQVEALLQPHQARAHGVTVNDVPRGAVAVLQLALSQNQGEHTA